MFLSILIATRNRPDKLKTCISSLLRSSYQNFEIIIADQSNDKHTDSLITQFNTKKIKYYKFLSVGKTKAVNKTIKKCRGEFICFIDDDNVVHKDWLQQINRILTKKKNDTVCAGILGQIFPYNETKPSVEYVCPVFVSEKWKRVTDPYVTYYTDLGLGSNLILRKDIFKIVHGYREWLGPGNFGFGGGEDGELMFRILKSGFSLEYFPEIIAYHNRWLNIQENRELMVRYTAGEAAFYSFYALRGDVKMLKKLVYIITSRIFLNEIIIKQLLKNILLIRFRSVYANRKSISQELKFTVWEFFFALKAILVGSFFSLSFKKI